MKKIIIIAGVAALAAVSSQAQGLVSIINGTAGNIKTNTAGNVSGNVSGANQYFFELLISANTSLASTANQIYGNAGNFGLWSDSGVTGVNGTGINAGKISASASTTATGWTAPGLAYDNLFSVLIVGWSANFGSTWASVQSAILLPVTLQTGGFLWCERSRQQLCWWWFW